MTKGTAGAGAVALVAVAAIAVFLVMRGGGGGEEKVGQPGTGKFTLGASVAVSQTTIDTGGGTITVGSNGGPIAGMTVEVPGGSYEKARNFKVSYRPITASTYKDFTPLGPLISVDNGGGYAHEPMTLRIPVKIPAGEKAVGVYYDEQTGAIEAMPLLTEDADSITVLTAHFTDIGVMKLIRAGAAAVAAASVPSVKVDSGFVPGVDDWEFRNWGAYPTVGGNCNGMSVSALWYYATQKVGRKAHQLYGLFDNNGKTPSSPALWQDDSWAYRYVTVVQQNLYPFEHFLQPDLTYDDTTTFWAISFAIANSHRPQLLWISGWNPKPSTTGKAADPKDPDNWSWHAILVYRVEGAQMFVADPNYPGDAKRPIELKNGKFTPYDTGVRAGTATVFFTWFAFMGFTGLADFTLPAFYWDLNPGNRLKDGTIGAGYFPEHPLSLMTPLAGGQAEAVLLKDGANVPASKATIGIAGDAMFAFWVDGVAGTSSRHNSPGSWINDDPQHPLLFYKEADVTLKPGPNVVGVWIVGDPSSHAPQGYIDFQYFTINYAAEVKISPNPTSGPPDKPISCTASMDSPPKSARWDWDFGDGVKKQDGGTAQSHAYKEGKYTLKVTVYDTSAKPPAVVGAGQAPVTVSKEPDALSVLQASKFLFVAVGGFVAKAPVNGQTVDLLTGSGSTQSGPVVWDGLNFTSSYNDGFTGWKITNAGTVAADGRSVTSLRMTVVADSGGGTTMTWQWTFANIGNPQIGVDPTYGQAWAVNLSGAATTAAFVSGTLTTAEFRAPIVPSGQLPASLVVSFSEKPILSPISR